MKYSNSERAEILVQALPYIREYYNKILVVKYGGNAMLTEEMKNSVMGDIALLELIGIKVVLVHGGGPEISEVLEKLGKKPEFIDGLRVTDRETVEVVQMVLCGKVNKGLVSLLGKMGSNAVGLCGADSLMLEAVKMDEVHGFVGKITHVNTKPILDVLDKGYIPVISTVAYDRDGNAYNVNADTAAAQIAAALKADALITMTDIDGILRDKNDPETLVSRVTLAQADALIADGVISGGMIPKIKCCTDAIKCGVKKVFIINGTIPHAIIIETLTDEGIGTMFVS